MSKFFTTSEISRPKGPVRIARIFGQLFFIKSITPPKALDILSAMPSIKFLNFSLFLYSSTNPATIRVITVISTPSGLALIIIPRALNAVRSFPPTNEAKAPSPFIAP